MAGAGENSVITKKRRTKLCKASAGKLEKLPIVTHMVFGDGGCTPEGEPVPPTDDQNNVKNEVGRYPVGEVTFPDETTARYTVTITEGEKAGVTINEVALLDGDGDAVAIKTMYPKVKDAGTEFTFTLDDKF